MTTKCSLRTRKCYFDVQSSSSYNWRMKGLGQRCQIPLLPVLKELSSRTMHEATFQAAQRLSESARKTLHGNQVWFNLRHKGDYATRLLFFNSALFLSRCLRSYVWVVESRNWASIMAVLLVSPVSVDKPFNFP